MGLFRNKRREELARRVESLEARAELFDKGLEVCVDAHKESLKDAEKLDEHLDGVWKYLVEVADVVRGLMRYLDVDRDKMMECIKAAKEDYEKTMAEMPQSRRKDEPQSRRKDEPQSRRRKDTEDIYLSSATRKLPQMPRNYVEKAMAACGIPIRYKEGEEGRAEYRIISREDVQKLADYVRMFLPKEGME